MRVTMALIVICATMLVCTFAAPVPRYAPDVTSSSITSTDHRFSRRSDWGFLSSVGKTAESTAENLSSSTISAIKAFASDPISGIEKEASTVVSGTTKALDDLGKGNVGGAIKDFFDSLRRRDVSLRSGTPTYR